MSGRPNPFTRYLAEGVPSKELVAFIDLWDRLEALVIAIYRGKAAGPDEIAEWDAIRQPLLDRYATLEKRLRPHWRQATVQGSPLEHDPFADLLATASAATFIDNWAAMQKLPAAREALNRLLLDEK